MLTRLSLILLGIKLSAQSDLTCRTYFDYFFTDVSKNCFYNPDLYAQTVS